MVQRILEPPLFSDPGAKQPTDIKTHVTTVLDIDRYSYEHVSTLSTSVVSANNLKYNIKCKITASGKNPI